MRHNRGAAASRALTLFAVAALLGGLAAAPVSAASPAGVRAARTAAPASGGSSGLAAPTVGHTSAVRAGSVDPRRQGVANVAGQGSAFGMPAAAGGSRALAALHRSGATRPARTTLPHWLPSRSGRSTSGGGFTAGAGTPLGRTVVPQAITTTPAADAGMGLRSSFGTFGLSDADDSLLYPDCSVNQLCEEPPDPGIAASATNVVETVNELVLILERGTGASRVIPNFDFFSLDNNQVNQSDPNVLYDASRKRWLATEISADCDHSYLHIAVSSSDDPFAAWTVYRIVFPGRVVDFPGLGTSASTVMVSLNVYGADPASTDCLSPGDYVGSTLVVADWADLTNTIASLPVTTLDTDPSLFTWRPAASRGGDPLGRLIVAMDTGADETADVGYATLTGTNAARDVTLSPVVDLTTDKGVAPFRQPPAPRQPGTPSTIANAVDGDSTAAMTASGHLWFIATTPCTPAGDGAVRDCVRLADLALGSTPDAVSLASDTVFQEAGTDLFMGGMGRSLDGTVYVTWTRSSSVARIAAYATWKAVGETAFHPPALLVPGGGDYSGSRWGDYVILATDPAQPDAVWQVNQVANVDSSWFTWISQLRPMRNGPLDGSVVIDSGDTYAGETFVDLTLANPPDVAVSVVRVANGPALDANGVLAGGQTLPVADDLPWSLAIDQPKGGPPDGTRTVYVQWGDGRGTWGDVTSDSIILDTTPPTIGAVNAPVVARRTLTASGGVPVVVTWGAGHDARSGLEGYDVEVSKDGGEWDPFAEATTNRASGAVQGGHRYQWRVRAFDRLSNVSDWSTGPSVRIDLTDDSSATIQYSSGWTRAGLKGAYGGGVHETSTPGASATLMFTGTGFGFAAATSPTAGAVDVYLDGRNIGRVQESAGAGGVSTILTYRRWTTSGRHTVKLIAVDGRRVTLDAFVLVR